MPDRVFTLIEQIFILLAIGVISAIGQALLLVNVPPWRQTLGRAIANAVLAMGAGAVLTFIPGLPQLGLIGIAALLATYGKASLERVAVKYLKAKGFIDDNK